MMNGQEPNNPKSRFSKEDFYQAFWGEPIRIAASLTTIAGIITSLISVYVIFAPDVIPPFIVVRDVLLILLLLGGLVFFSYQYVHATHELQDVAKKLEEEQNKPSNELKWQRQLTNQLGYSQRVARDLRNWNFHSFFSPIAGEIAPLELLGEETMEFEHICKDVSSTLRNSLISYFDTRHINVANDLSVCVKLLISAQCLTSKYYEVRLTKEAKQKIESNDRYIITVYRDPVTHATRTDREVSQLVYTIQDNTAFTHIFINNQQYYACDNLRELWRQGKYLNENPEWTHQYNSTLVVPIQFHDKATNHHHYFGLIAVDSLNEEGYPLYEGNGDCLAILTHAADLLSNFFLTLSLHQYYEYKLADTSKGGRNRVNRSAAGRS